jgi:hypothetical protein
MAKHKVETFNDGMAEIFCTENVAEPGDAPKIKLKLKARLRFGWQTLTLKRKLASLQFDSEITDVIRIPLNRWIINNDVIKLNGEAQTYKVELVQHVISTTPSKTVLTLKRLDIGEQQ